MTRYVVCGHNHCCDQHFEGVVDHQAHILTKHPSDFYMPNALIRIWYPQEYAKGYRELDAVKLREIFEQGVPHPTEQELAFKFNKMEMLQPSEKPKAGWARVDYVDAQLPKEEAVKYVPLLMRGVTMEYYKQHHGIDYEWV